MPQALVLLPEILGGLAAGGEAAAGAGMVAGAAEGAAAGTAAAGTAAAAEGAAAGGAASSGGFGTIARSAGSTLKSINSSTPVQTMKTVNRVNTMHNIMSGPSNQQNDSPQQQVTQDNPNFGQY